MADGDIFIPKTGVSYDLDYIHLFASDASWQLDIGLGLAYDTYLLRLSNQNDCWDLYRAENILLSRDEDILLEYNVQFQCSKIYGTAVNDAYLEIEENKMQCRIKSVDTWAQLKPFKYEFAFQISDGRRLDLLSTGNFEIADPIAGTLNPAGPFTVKAQFEFRK